MFEVEKPSEVGLGGGRCGLDVSSVKYPIRLPWLGEAEENQECEGLQRSGFTFDCLK